jgi:hypothetical protein
MSVGSWQWYINIPITILDIIHRPVFYLNLNSTLYVCLNLHMKMVVRPKHVADNLNKIVIEIEYSNSKK